MKLLHQWFFSRRAHVITMSARMGPSASSCTTSLSAAALLALLGRNARSSSQSTLLGRIPMWSCHQPKFALRQTSPSRYVTQNINCQPSALLSNNIYRCIYFFILKEQGLLAKMLTKLESTCEPAGCSKITEALRSS